MGWGCFFLHELDLKRIRISAVPEEDSTALIKEYKAPFRTKRSQGKEPAPSELISHHRSTTLYPWGKIVSEPRLIELINTVPQQFLKDPMHLSIASLRHPDSSLIFMSFTSEIWLLLAEQFSTAGVNAPVDLEAAMDIWSLKSIRQICDEVTIHPTHDLLKKMGSVKKPKSEEVFGGKRKFFFPSPTDLDASPLKPFTMHETSYLSRYHHVLNNQSAEEIESLDMDLDDIFSKLQCLPAAINERGRHTIWKTEGGRVKFLINSFYYRIEGVSMEREACVRRRAQLTCPAFQKRLYEAMSIFYAFFKTSTYTDFRYGRKSYRKRKTREEKHRVDRKRKRRDEKHRVERKGNNSTTFPIGQSLQSEKRDTGSESSSGPSGEIYVSDASST